MGIGNNKDAKAILTEDALAIAGDRELKVISHLFTPHLEVLMSEVDFNEGSGDSCGCLELEICVRDKAQLRSKGLIKSEPAD